MTHETKLRATEGRDLSHFAWAVLGQLAKGSVWDGDLVCKSGRDELIKRGLARRECRDTQGLAINELTPAGLHIAVHLNEGAGHA